MLGKRDDVTATTPDTPLRALARALGQHGVSGMPVVDDGAVVGVISEADVPAKAQRTPKLRTTRGRLERRLHPRPVRDAGTVLVEVDDSRAVLTGVVGSEDQAEALRETVRQIPGVVEVRSELSFSAGSERRGAPATAPRAT